MCLPGRAVPLALPWVVLPFLGAESLDSPKCVLSDGPWFANPQAGLDEGEAREKGGPSQQGANLEQDPGKEGSMEEEEVLHRVPACGHPSLGRGPCVECLPCLGTELGALLTLVGGVSVSVSSPCRLSSEHSSLTEKAGLRE